MSSQTVLLMTTLPRTIVLHFIMYDMNPGFEPFTTNRNCHIKIARVNVSYNIVQLMWNGVVSSVSCAGKQLIHTVRVMATR